MLSVFTRNIFCMTGCVHTCGSHILELHILLSVRRNFSIQGWCVCQLQLSAAPYHLVSGTRLLQALVLRNQWLGQWFLGVVDRERSCVVILKSSFRLMKSFSSSGVHLNSTPVFLKAVKPCLVLAKFGIKAL